MASSVGVTFSLTGNDPIPTDGSGRVRIFDIGYNDEDALICRSERNIFTSTVGNWFLHPTETSTDNGDPDDDSDYGDRIVNDYNRPDQGWRRNRGLDSGHRLVRLRRVTDTAEEGVFTCDIREEDNTPRSVGIYYPSESLHIVTTHIYSFTCGVHTFIVSSEQKCN